MINWAGLEAIQLINPSVLRDEGDEVRVALGFDV